MSKPAFLGLRCYRAGSGNIETHFDAIAPEIPDDLDARATQRVFADGPGPNTVFEAFGLQRAIRSLRNPRGESVMGFKIGYTSQSIRRNLVAVMGPQESVNGCLWDSESYQNNATIDHRRLAIEGELGVKLLSTYSEYVSEWQVAHEPITEPRILVMEGSLLDDHGGRGMN